MPYVENNFETPPHYLEASIKETLTKKHKCKGNKETNERIPRTQH